MQYPTPSAPFTGTFVPEEEDRLAASYQAALLADLDRALAQLPPEQVAVQWDVAVEFAMGENLPFSLARADEKLSPLTGLTRSVAETVREQVLITTAGYTTSPPLLCALLVFGADRILFSVDYPFSDNLEATLF